MAGFLSLFIAWLFVVSMTEASIIGKLPNPTNKYFNNPGSTRIVGGRPAKQGETPYQLSMRLLLDYHICGASLVEVNGLQVGVTAGHCVDQNLIGYLNVVAGDIDISDHTGLEQRIVVESIVTHENYNEDKLQNDIALLFFNGSFALNQNVQSVPLPRQGQVTFEGNLTVSGWGDLEYLGSPPDALQIVEIPLVNDTYCQQAYENYTIGVIDSMICAGVATGDLSPCHGDSGGPAISDDGYLAGIVSWGYDCGHPNYPGVFTKVAYFVDWIEDTVADYKNSLKI